jgi:small-conductance mechanosensitive channel
MNDNKKNEWAAAIASFFIAGWGQVYNGESWIKGWSFFIGRICFFIICTLLGCLGYLVSSPALYIFLYIGFFSLIILWIPIALYDAYVAFSTAQKMNKGLLPFNKTIGIRFWGYSLPIIIWTLMIIVFLIYSLGSA